MQGNSRGLVDVVLQHLIPETDKSKKTLCQDSIQVPPEYKQHYRPCLLARFLCIWFAQRMGRIQHTAEVQTDSFSLMEFWRQKLSFRNWKLLRPCCWTWSVLRSGARRNTTHTVLSNHETRRKTFLKRLGFIRSVQAVYLDWPLSCAWEVGREADRQ
jgi:hypothetical protein